MLSILLVSGSFTVAMATHKEGASHTPVKIVQGTLKALDAGKGTVTVEIVEGQAVTLKLAKDALENLHRTFKKGHRVELRISGSDMVESLDVGTGP
ncbi:MAG: hypothetical protein HYR81_05890 [Nitrospirae bacterium]|nr:hypothetical protein [Nitrospirota bacterium]